MSKVLKFIVHLVVICTLVCVLGLVLPPFFGVRTVIVDKADEATNLPVGSVTYAIPEKSSAISVGTPILVQKDSKTYKYTITNIDASKGTGTVTDQSVSGDKNRCTYCDFRAFLRNCICNGTYRKVRRTVGLIHDHSSHSEKRWKNKPQHTDQSTYHNKMYNKFQYF